MMGGKPVIQVDTVDSSLLVPEIVEGPKKADRASQADISTRLTRAKRSTVSKKDT